MWFWQFLGWLVIVLCLDSISDRLKIQNHLQKETNELLKNLLRSKDDGP